MKRLIIAAMIVAVMLFAIAFSLEAVEVSNNVGKTETVQAHDALDLLFQDVSEIEKDSSLFRNVIFENENEVFRTYVVITVCSSITITDRKPFRLSGQGSAKNKFVI